MKPAQITTVFDPVTMGILWMMFFYLHILGTDPARLLSPRFGVISLPDTNQIMVQDFTNLYHYVRGVFQQVSDNPYRISEMNQMLTDWTGGAAGFMPFLSPPTILLSFGPLTIFPAGIAYTIWMGISFMGAAWTVAAFRRFPIAEKWWPLILGWVAYFNLTCMMTINLGQTVFLTNTALLAILLLTRRHSRGATWSIALLLLLLTGKPQVSLVAVFYLAAERRWKELWLASLTCLLFCILVTPLFGWSWPLDYIHAMTTYGSETAPVEISETIGTTIMTNLRALCVETGTMSDTLAVRSSWLLFLAGGSSLYFLKRRLPVLPAGIVFALACMVYLLTSPHLNPHEDFLLLPAVYAVLGSLPERKRIHWYGALALMLCGLLLNMDMGAGFSAFLRPFHTVFWAKLLFMIYLLTLVGRCYSDNAFFLHRQTTEQEKNLP